MFFSCGSARLLPESRVRTFAPQYAPLWPAPAMPLNYVGALSVLRLLSRFLFLILFSPPGIALPLWRPEFSASFGPADRVGSPSVGLC